MEIGRGATNMSQPVRVLHIVTSALTVTVFFGLHAQTQCLPCPPLFYGRTGWAESFLQVLVTGIVTKHKQKIPSQVYVP